MKPRPPLAAITRLCLFLTFLIGSTLLLGAQSFVHPGCLSTQADLDRMKAKVLAGEQPWLAGWNRLIANSHAQLTWTPNPQGTICRGGGCSGLGLPENYMTLANDIAAAYQCALRYHISGNTAYADKAVQIMNAWSGTLTNLTGDSNVSLAAGIYGYEFACAGELMRNYAGWAAADFARFQTMMLTIFYPLNSDFLVRHHNTCASHYWANWDLCNIASVLAIGVLCDDRAKYDEAVNYFKTGVGMGALTNTIYFLHPGYLGQWQEAGRDQGHCVLGPALLGPICEIAWNQGDDLYGYLTNRFLAGAESVAKYNVNTNNTVPYITYINCDPVIQPGISSAGRGNLRPSWEMVYHHYVNRVGLAAPFTKQFAELVRPEGGGGDYGSTSGGYDQLGFGTLTHTLDPIASGATPSGLTAHVVGNQATLSWWGAAYAASYNVKRATVSGGPYTTVATVTGNRYLEPGLSAGPTYYYVVSANNPGGESANSAELAVAANGRLTGSVIGTAGSFNNLGAAKECVFDGGLKNYFDGPSASGVWAGLDLGAGASAVITQVEYCPRAGFPSRMVGGVFQGANDPDFASPTTLYTISTAPPEGVLTAQAVANGTAFRYVRYLSPANGFGNVAEVRFSGNLSGLAAPATPAGLAANVIAPNQINLSWSASTGATSYNLKRATASGGPYTIVANGVETSFNDTGAADGVTYYYVVSALNQAGESASSSAVTASTPVAPVKLTGVNIGTSGSWGGNPGTTKDAALDGFLITFYDGANVSGDWVGLDLGTAEVITQVKYCPRSAYAARMTGGVFQGANDASFTSPVTLFTISGSPTEGVLTAQTITEPTAFRYVRYLSPTGGYCNVAEVEFYKAAPLPPPAAPTGLIATAGNAQVALSWSASSGATSYNVKRATGSGGPYTVVTNVTTVSHTDAGLVNGAAYYYVVSAVNANGESANSNEASATPTGAAPTYVAAGSISSGTGSLTPALPAGIASGDILLLFLETANQTISISNPNGGTWAQVTGSPQGTGTAGSTSATRLTVFWSRYNGTQGAPTTTDSGDHQAGRMIAIRGAAASGNPWDVTAGGVEATADPSASIPGATTTVNNTLVVVAVAGSLPDSNSTSGFSAWSNASLSSLTERTDNTRSSGNGGALGIATGVKVTAGASGNTAVTHASSATKGMISIAIKN